MSAAVHDERPGPVDRNVVAGLCEDRSTTGSRWPHREGRPSMHDGTVASPMADAPGHPATGPVARP